MRGCTPLTPAVTTYFQNIEVVFLKIRLKFEASNVRVICSLQQGNVFCCIRMMRVKVNGVLSVLKSKSGLLSLVPAKRSSFNVLRLLLPAGYPSSVTPDYLPHQIWTFVKNCASASTYVLSMHCLLTAVGMQSEVALPLSAVASWVLKDGLGAAGVMLAASRFGRVVDSRVKSARWVSELGMVVGAALEMMTPLVPGVLFLPLASVANTFKGL
jgi:hypothetical protein